MSQDKIDLATAETEKGMSTVTLAEQVGRKAKQVLARIEKNDQEMNRLLAENNDLIAYAQELIRQQAALVRQIDNHAAVSTALLDRVGREDDA